MNDRVERFTPADLQRIEAESLVRQVDFHRELPSTNDRACQLARRPSIETPLLVLAERQTAGRGRGAHRWWSPLGALSFSLVIEPPTAPLLPKHGPQLSLTTGLAVCAALEQFLPHGAVGLKWPNDLQLQGRKVCGILVESPAACAGRVIIGIGINVNNCFAAAPDELRSIAISLADATKKQVRLVEVLTRVLRELEARLALLGDVDARLAQEWQHRSILDGRLVHLRSGSQRTSGICRGIDRSGALVLDAPEGRQRWFSGVIERVQ